ncbi:MAG: hypothetical protein ACERK6_14055 [Candidatus Aminicenantaceae bacterium]
MLKKEFRDTAYQFVECMLILLAIPIAYLTDKLVIHFQAPFLDILEVVVMLTFLAFPVYAGATLFQAEKKDRAFEYLLSLPLTRKRILWNKLMPRLVFILGLVLVLFIARGGHPALNLGIVMFVLFSASVFLSLPVDSVIIAFLGVGMLYYLFQLCAKMIYYLMISLWRAHILSYNPREEYSSQVIAALIVLTPLGIAFWKTYKNFDLKTMRLQLKPYLVIALPSIVAVLALAVFYFTYYLNWLYSTM